MGNYAKVVAKDVWPGIDVEYRAQAEGVETVYRVKPGADPAQIMIQYEGLDAPLSVDANGSLLLKTSLGKVKEQAPFAYQIVNGRQVEVRVRYRVMGSSTCALSYEAFDSTKEMVVDPLVYVTRFAHGNEDLSSLAATTEGRPVIAGFTDGWEFPITPGVYQESVMPWGSYYVTEFSADGDSLIFSTFFGGGANDEEMFPRVRIAPGGQIYLVGSSAHCPWPLTSNAFDTTRQAMEIGISRLSADGSTLEFSSFLGGSGDDLAFDVQFDSLGRVYVVGRTMSLDFPITPDAMNNHQTLNGGFLSIFDPDSGSIVYSTYYNDGVSSAVAADIDQIVVKSRNNVWIKATIAGGSLPVTPDAMQSTYGATPVSYFAHLDLVHGAILYATYFGNMIEPGGDNLQTLIPVDSNRMWLFGQACTCTFSIPDDGYDAVAPVPPATKAFALELRLPNTILRGTYLKSAVCLCAGRDANSRFFIGGAGGWGPDSFPTTPDAIGQHYSGGGDAVLARFSPNLDSLTYSTLLGGSLNDYATAMVIPVRNVVWLAGITSSEYDFPVTPDALFPDPAGVFLARIEFPFDDATPKGLVTGVPTSLILSCSPNPFNPSTVLTFTLPKTSSVVLDVYDILGRSVYREELGRLVAGNHQHVFDGSALASGVYFAKVQAGRQEAIRKILLIR